MKITILSNCQHLGIQRCARRLIAKATFDSFHLRDLRQGRDIERCLESVRQCDLAIVHPQAPELLEAAGEKLECSHAVFLPPLSFSGFHPDVTVLHQSVPGYGRIRSATGNYHSLLAMAGFLSGRDERETEALFNRLVYSRLGYFAAFEICRTSICREFRKCGLKLGDLIDKWMQRGPFMHSVNHPRIHAIHDVVRRLLKTHGIRHRPIELKPGAPDPLERLHTFPVYPEIAEALGFEGAYAFRTPRPELRTLTLSEYLVRTFATYRQIPREALESVPAIERLRLALPELAETLKR